MALSRWEPFREMISLREAMDRLFEESFIWPSRLIGTSGRTMFPLDVRERDDNYEIRAELPGVRPEDLDITVQGGMLTIRAQTRQEEERPGENWILRERRTGIYERSITLPTSVDVDQAQARFEHGVLHLTLPKAAEARPKRIPIGGPTGRAVAEPTAGSGTTPSTAPGGTGTPGTFGRAQVRETMDVIGSDGNDVGRVKEVRDNDFLVDRAMQRDIYIPYSAIQSIHGERIMLNIPAGQVDAMGWPTSEMLGTSRPAGGPTLS